MPLTTTQGSCKAAVQEHFETETSIEWQNCSKIKSVKAQKKEKERSEKRYDLGEGGKGVRTLCHVRHFPDLPGGEITIEGTSIGKHCTTATKKSPTINIGLKKKEERALFKNRISAATERRREIEAAKKRPDLGEGGEKE